MAALVAELETIRQVIRSNAKGSKGERVASKEKLAASREASLPSCNFVRFFEELRIASAWGMRFFLSLVSCLVMSSTALAQATVSGTISTNTTWTIAGSPYMIASNANVIVSAGVILTIQPSVVVKGQNPASQLTVNGTLLANGT